MTITDDVRHALEVGERRWPRYVNKPASLLAALAVEGARSIEAEPSPIRAPVQGIRVLSNGGIPLDVAAIEEALAHDY